MTDTEKMDCSVEPFGFDWTAFYDRFGLDPTINPITSSVWEVLSGDSTLGAEGIASPETTVFVDGGTAGTATVLKNTIEIGGGVYKDCRTLYIEVN